ncbi:MAG: hypothetical protein PHU25_03525 [Deltaproteobacteria bacterium]|nr:hypothetical protein [Deltaproteobacteria bacterium]
MRTDTRHTRVTTLVTALSLLTLAPPLAAQEAAPQPAQGRAAKGPPVEDGSVKAEDEKDGHDFAWFSVAPEAGYTYFAPATITVQGVDFHVAARSSVLAKLHLDLGGDGLAVEIAPLYSWESGGGRFGNFNSVGAELTLAWRFKLGSFYPGLGVGFHGTYIMGDDIALGAECYGRLPVGFTWYFSEYAALVLEVGLMYGGTGIRAKDIVVDVGAAAAGNETKEQAANNALASNIAFGAGFAVDAVLGIRFP